MKVIYVLEIFTRVSETFILNEILKIQDKGIDVEVFAFSKGAEDTVHAGAGRVRKITYASKASIFTKLYAHFYWFIKKPSRYFQVFIYALNKNNGISNIFLTKLYDVILIQKRTPDIIHAHFGWWASDMAMSASLLTGIPFTFTTHGSDVLVNPPKNYRLKSNLAKKHIVVSNYNKRYMIEQFGVNEAQLELVRCGVDFSRRFPPKINPVKNRIISIARLHRIKGLDYLVEACFRLKQQGIDFECLIVGEGPERKNLESQIQNYGLTSELKLLGSKTQEEVFNLLATSTIKVLASRSESMPVALMEAMACGVSVIGPRIRGVAELVEEGRNGFLVEPGDVEVLSEKIKTLLSDENLRKKFIETGYKKVFNEFNLEYETDKLIQIWKN